jgi:tetratricopeptide (TPR) repeat protein
MSQVRKDILNGWKEIGGYVCRDIRTVERWEKQRGLPVRRVPGAGRATVYALIPELDEWLENSKPELTDPVADSSATVHSSDLRAQANSDTPPQWVTVATVRAPEAEHFLGIRATEATPSPEVGKLAPAIVESIRKPRGDAHSLLQTGHRKWVVGVTAAVAVGLACLLASPLVRSHANPAVGPSKYAVDPGENSSQAPYRSKIAGVDDLYLRGVYLSEQRTPESLERSLDDFSTAIARDPNYAPAYASLANTYNLLREYSMMPDAEAYPKARAAAEHAVALDPKLAQAHASLGFIDFFWSWDSASAEREFKTALALDPSSVVSHHWYGSMLIHEGRYNEAIDQLNLAQRLDPTSEAVLSTRALALGLSGRRGEAVDMLQDVISQTPGVSSPHAFLALLSRVEPRDTTRFLDETRKAAEMRHSDEMLQVAAAAEPAFKSGGENAMWTAILATEDRLHPGASNRTYLMVEAEAALGLKDAAFADLHQLALRRDPTLMGIVLDPTLAPLHQDERYGQLVSSMGLPPVLH